MGNRSHWLGFLAVGLAAVALLVAVTGRSYGSRAFERGPRSNFYGPGAATRPAPQSAPDAGQAPNPGAAQAPDAGRPGWSRHVRPDFRGFEHGRGFERGPRFGRGPHLPFFGGAFMMLRGVWEALLAIVLIVLGLRLLRGRPGPGNEPHTGETRRL
jgi:hypothetical protein